MTARSLPALYLLSQVCVVVTYWAVFPLGRAIVGAQQAAIAVLLMVGISTFTVATPEFGPAILAMPLWAMALLHYWRVVGGATAPATRSRSRSMSRSSSSPPMRGLCWSAFWSCSPA